MVLDSALREQVAENAKACDKGEKPGRYILPALGEAGRGYVRLNFATPLPILTDIVERVGALVRAS